VLALLALSVEAGYQIYEFGRRLFGTTIHRKNGCLSMSDRNRRSYGNTRSRQLRKTAVR
jgi:hypothetical protein